ncbi:MAG: hypothetical protein M3R15_19605 [Acidobacteriota bacterium]|nr:hypothetical protein [Acidobacteriota bacterium]
MTPSPAVDAHAHVFDPARFPLRYTGGHMLSPSECGTPAQFLAVLGGRAPPDYAVNQFVDFLWCVRHRLSV